MNRDRIAAKHRLYIAFTNQVGKVRSAASMYHYGTTGDHQLTTAIANLAKFPCDLFDNKFDATFAGHTRTHEGKLFLLSSISSFRFTDCSHAIITNDHAIAYYEIAQKLTVCRAIGTNCDRCIHPLIIATNPYAIYTGFRRINCADIEVIRSNSIL